LDWAKKDGESSMDQNQLSSEGGAAFDYVNADASVTVLIEQGVPHMPRLKNKQGVSCMPAEKICIVKQMIFIMWE
jgi:hypothetical protein